MKYDVVIIGSGPAGAYCAYSLAKYGIKVLIIDKEKFPRDKVCGGGISQKTIDILEFDIDPIVQRYIKGAYLTYRNKGIVVKSLEKRNGVSVLRSEFDNFILQKAIEKGADFIDECQLKSIQQGKDFVNLVTTQGEFTSEYLIGADGVYSKVRKEVFGDGLVEYAPAIEALMYVSKDILDQYNDHTLFDFGGMKRGYGWIFPKKDHLNVGVFSIFGSKNIRSALKDFISLYPSLKNSTDVKTIGFSIPTKNNKKKYAQDRVILVGDAAGFAESFYGEGIYFALKSGELAANAIKNSEGNRVSVRYDELVKKQLENDLFYSRLNAQLFFPVQNFGYHQMVRNKYVNHFFSELIGGSVGHKECFYKTLFSSPYWLFSSKYEYNENVNV